MSLRLEDVSKQFGGLRAVSNVTFNAEPGRVTGLIGPNGAGKTTVVNLITGILSLTEGRIAFGDDDLTTMSPTDVARRGIVRTFQNVRLLLDETVVANVALGFYRHGKSSMLADIVGLPSARAEIRMVHEQAHRLLHQFGLEPYADTLVRNLSYGHQRRVEMARALAAKPSLLLLDEPVAGMNDVEANELGAIFTDLAASGIAVLLVEHNIRLVSSICEDLVVLDTGRMIASGKPGVVLSDPAVVQAYLGA